MVAVRGQYLVMLSRPVEARSLYIYRPMVLSDVNIGAAMGLNRSSKRVSWLAPERIFRREVRECLKEVISRRELESVSLKR
jgi:hypothetical protein